VTAAEVVLDVTGLRCPLPVIRLARLARSLENGSVITVLTTDPAAGPDIAAWCRMRGHHLLGQSVLEPRDQSQPDGEQLVSRVRVGRT
jgi:tRNA 2-thiouridine synthesizing protein A